jgi:hypothetical protein
MLPDRSPSWHCHGPGDVPLVAKRSRYVAVAIPYRDSSWIVSLRLGHRNAMRFRHIDAGIIAGLKTWRRRVAWTKTHVDHIGRHVSDSVSTDRSIRTSDEGASNMGGCCVLAAIQPLDQADAARTRIASTAGPWMLGTTCRQPHLMNTPQSAGYSYLRVSFSSNSLASTSMRELALRTSGKGSPNTHGRGLPD